MKIPIDIKTGSVKKETETKDIIVGIDLGTTNSLVAIIEDGIPSVIKDESGSEVLMPSVLFFHDDGKIITGLEAKKHLIDHPARTIKSVKRLMGKSYADVKDFTTGTAYEIIDSGTDQLVKIKMDENFYTPVELSAEILKSLKSRAEKYIGSKISRAVITVPAYFNDTQRQATRDAGKLAGLDVLRIINEPTAASLAYGIGLNTDQNEIVAVYDLGGGTFDISVLHIENGIFEVLSTQGDTDLGGDDIDNDILQHWVNENEGLSEKIVDFSLYGKLLFMAEEAKIHLSHDDLYAATLTNDFQLTLTKAEFYNICKKWVDKTIKACESAIRDAKITVKDIHKVILVGGSTRNPYVKQRLTEFFGMTPHDEMNPDEAVALGAAIQADILAGNRKDMLLLDVAPLSLGIETVGGLMDVIIPRNSKIPHKAGRQYTTSVDGQKNLKISVFQGERDLVANNRKLGEFILKDIPPMPAGLPKIDIHFLIDADGILTVKAKELRSDTEARIEINASFGISEEKMAEMLLDSIQHAKEDADQKALIESTVEAQNVLLATDKFLIQNQDIMTETESGKIRELKSLVEDAIGQKNKNLIESNLKNLNDFAAPIAQRSMDSLISFSLKGKSLENSSDQES